MAVAAEPAPECALEPRPLYRFYRSGDEETLALQGVSLRVESGDLVAVTGPSGSGKFQSANLVEHLNVGQNVALVHSPAGQFGRDTEILSVLGLQDRSTAAMGRRARWRPRSR